MLEQEQLVGDASVLALLDERVLEIERCLVFDDAEAADFEIVRARRRRRGDRIRARLRRSSPAVP
jgi:hypothetical protein